MLLSWFLHNLGNSANVYRAKCRLFPNLFRCEGVFAYPVYEIQAVSHWKWSCSFPSWTGCAGIHHHLLPTFNTTLWGLWPGDKYLIAPHSCIHPGCPLPVLLFGRQRRVGKTQGLKGWFLSSQSQMMGGKNWEFASLTKAASQKLITLSCVLLPCFTSAPGCDQLLCHRAAQDRELMALPAMQLCPGTSGTSSCKWTCSTTARSKQ